MSQKTYFATCVMSAALSGALGELEEYFDESQYIQSHIQKTAEDQASL